MQNRVFSIIIVLILVSGVFISSSTKLNKNRYVNLEYNFVFNAPEGWAQSRIPIPFNERYSLTEEGILFFGPAEKASINIESFKIQPNQTLEAAAKDIVSDLARKYNLLKIFSQHQIRIKDKSINAYEIIYAAAKPNEMDLLTRHKNKFLDTEIKFLDTDSAIRQNLVILKKNNKAFLLKCTTVTKNYSKFSPVFTKSIDSFRFYEK